MKNFFAFIGVVVVVAIALGLYYGWYSFAVKQGPDGQQAVSVETNTQKVKEDLKQLTTETKEKVGEAIDNLKKKDGTAEPVAPPTSTTKPGGNPPPITIIK